MTKQTKATTETDAPKNGPGRPRTFDASIETKARLYHLPVETSALIEQEATKREIPLTAALDMMVNKAFREFNRKKKAKN